MLRGRALRACLVAVAFLGSGGCGGGGLTVDPPPTPPATPTPGWTDALVADCGNHDHAYGPIAAERPITFDGRLSRTPHPPITAYKWSFGDHTEGVGVTPTHIYHREGYEPERTFVVTLRIVDSAKQSATCQTSVLVTDLY